MKILAFSKKIDTFCSTLMKLGVNGVIFTGREWDKSCGISQFLNVSRFVVLGLKTLRWVFDLDFMREIMPISS